MSGLWPITQHAMMFHNGIAFHEYESFAIRADERERIAADLGEKDIMILRNHGMPVGGPSVGEGFHTAYHLERACRVQLLATAGHVPLQMPQPVAAEATARRLRSMTQEHRFKYSFRFRLFRFALPLLTPVDRMRIVVSNV
jgi:ribulose-5-phosphate 4-epimerase/fuculose-1-phosphate aldolase